jgi:hypothetical protein
VHTERANAQRLARCSKRQRDGTEKKRQDEKRIIVALSLSLSLFVGCLSVSLSLAFSRQRSAQEGKF